MTDSTVSLKLEQLWWLIQPFHMLGLTVVYYWFDTCVSAEFTFWKTPIHHTSRLYELNCGYFCIALIQTAFNDLFCVLTHKWNYTLERQIILILAENVFSFFAALLASIQSVHICIEMWMKRCCWRVFSIIISCCTCRSLALDQRH